MVVNVQLPVAASRERVWSLITEPEQQRKWMTGLVDNRQLHDGPARPGVEFEFDIRERNKTSTYPGEFLVYSPSDKLAIRFWIGKRHGRLAIHVSYLLTPSSAGTQLDYRCELNTDNAGVMLKWLFWTLGPLMNWGSTRVVRRQLEKMKQLAEGRGENWLEVRDWRNI